jgi:hypothetical protein
MIELVRVMMILPRKEIGRQETRSICYLEGFPTGIVFFAYLGKLEKEWPFEMIGILLMGIPYDCVTGKAVVR